jgi:hypothetical protein
MSEYPPMVREARMTMIAQTSWLEPHNTAPNKIPPTRRKNPNIRFFVFD